MGAIEQDRDVARVARQTDLAFALEASGLGTWEIDLTSGQLIVSSTQRSSLGLTPSDSMDKLAEFEAIIHPEDRVSYRDATRRAISGRTDLDHEFRIVRTNGSVAWLLVRGRADYDADGQPLRMAGITLDTTERRQTAERQKQLLDELNHRVKNMLASVQSIARHTERSARSPAEFVNNLDFRLEALAAAHDLLVGSAWAGAPLEALVRRSVALHAGEEPIRRFQVTGPPVRCSPNAAVTLAMALQELAANAARFGALSMPDGSVEVDWRIEPDGTGLVLAFDWTERGGPAAVEPEHRGFGLRLLEQNLPREFDGTVVLRFADTGFDCRMRLPLSNKLQVSA